MRNRLTVLADRSGKILAAYEPGPYLDGAPTHIALSAREEGHVVREVEMPEQLSKTGLTEKIFREYRLHIREQGCEMVAIHSRKKS